MATKSTGLILNIGSFTTVQCFLNALATEVLHLLLVWISWLHRRVCQTYSVYHKLSSSFIMLVHDLLHKFLIYYKSSWWIQRLQWWSMYLAICRRSFWVQNLLWDIAPYPCGSCRCELHILSFDEISRGILIMDANGHHAKSIIN